jgi:hypothetical protein
MNPRFCFLGGLGLLALSTTAFAETSTESTPPGPVTIIDLTNAEPVTPAPPQANAKSAPGAASPNGSNGTTATGHPITKAPYAKTKPDASADEKISSAATAKATPAPSAPPAATASVPAEKTASPASKAGASIFDNYLDDLNDAVGFSPEEKTEISHYYTADGAALKNILDDSSLSPLQQNQQVDDLRQKRDAKIDALLTDPTRRHAFYEVEARYRVALVEFAANGGFASTTPGTKTSAL